MVSILMAELITDQVLPPKPHLQENSHTRPCFHWQFFCPSASCCDISARPKTSSLNCHQPCLRWIKTSWLPLRDVPQKCHFYSRQVTHQLPVFLSLQEEGAEGGDGKEAAAADLDFPMLNFPLMTLQAASLTSVWGTCGWHHCMQGS